MNTSASCDVPFEPQQAERTCGAAALCMVYRSFGLPCTQSEIWDRIARPGPWQSLRTNTRQLAADALGQGLAALIQQARDPWGLLQRSMSRSARAIVNHRPSAGSRAGHYSVVVGLDDESVIVHDPHRGPSRRLGRAEFLDLWQPAHGGSEITGHVLVAFARVDACSQVCDLCGKATPELLTCGNCRAPIRLQPAEGLGCPAAECRGRTWERIFCPGCDLAISDLTGHQAGVAAQGWRHFANLTFSE